MSAYGTHTYTIVIADDHELCQSFMEWQLVTGVFPIRGTVSSGLGGYTAAFDASNEKAINDFLMLKTPGSAD